MYAYRIMGSQPWAWPTPPADASTSIFTSFYTRGACLRPTAHQRSRGVVTDLEGKPPKIGQGSVISPTGSSCRFPSDTARKELSTRDPLDKAWTSLYRTAPVFLYTSFVAYCTVCHNYVFMSHREEIVKAAANRHVKRRIIQLLWGMRYIRRNNSAHVNDPGKPGKHRTRNARGYNILRKRCRICQFASTPERPLQYSSLCFLVSAMNCSSFSSLPDTIRISPCLTTSARSGVTITSFPL